jgi:hypothetical protein
MRFDRQNLISDKQAITVTAVSTDKIDRKGGTPGFTLDNLGNTPKDDPSRSPELMFMFTVTEQFTAAGAATLQIDLVADDDPALGSPTVLGSTGPIGKALLVPGKKFFLNVPQHALDADRYIGANYTVATGPMTAGKITAGVVTESGVQTAPGSSS